jgi:hypothetical protein
VVGEGAAASGREAAALALLLGGGAEDVGPLLGDADHDHALLAEQGGVGEVGCGDGLLALPLLEMDDGDAPLLGELLDGGHELAGHLAEELVAWDLLASVLAQEPAELVSLLELGHVAVEEDAVDGLVHERDVLVE